ncbi:Gastrula zinc finger protein XLCGF64.1, putative [Pediculus humanus corporis]|uniref:Gastrula zinc finger protein XLCGF64.1, putative n=1 Tax=Pediculus humanus subsp. corporis TaxID=121224 RepID=E0W0D2_PEDHC|nr:Gastrula zinc finger protein XLCGF64.1, putative [Pediculus humanus corporis]EEB19088.1 Gastrula zinc finger protein XLCGF64.1, putative [Pediculus humanus corporis]
MEQRQTQNFPNLPPNVFIQYTTPQNNGDKNYYKIENIPFQPNAVNINLGQPISLINQPCVLNQNNTSFIGNSCVTTAAANYVSLSTGNWNHGMQQIMYPIIDNTGSLDGHQLATKQTVDANVLTTGTCTVLSPAKNIPKKHIINIVGDETHSLQELQEEIDEKGKKKGKTKEKENENSSFGCQICGEEFKSKGSLRFHMFHHNPKSKNKFQCIGCNEGFEKEKLKQEHELNCEQNYKLAELECCFCDLPCSTPKQLRNHENKHRPIRKTKRYRNTCVCIECKKAFDAILSLKVHIQKHHKKSHVKPLENKPFTCSECGLGFRYERSKIKHEFKAHTKQESTSL